MTLRSGLYLLLVLATAPIHAADEGTIETLRSVQGASGAVAAREAATVVVAGGATELLPLLKGFDGATRLGGNWLRGAFETIASAELAAERPLPADDLTRFILDRANAPAARRLAYEWLKKQDETAEASLIPGLLQDIHPDFRRDAVALLLEEAKSLEGEDSAALYRRALQGAVHDDQVKEIVTALKAADEEVSVLQHFGFLPQWKIIGPFDNREMKGYAVAYPPESEIALDVTYEGQLGDVVWQDISTDDDYGIVNIGDQIENYKGSLMYAVASFTSTSNRNVQLRLGTPNAWKLWVNGELVFEREEYHRGTQLDQYVIPVSFRSGNNVIMLKVCQNEQEQSWAQDYKFQLRVTDTSGAAIQPAEEGQ